MKCPYTIDETVQVNEYTYDENGGVKKHRLIEQRKLMECVKDDCAAWHKGKCQYRGAVN